MSPNARMWVGLGLLQVALVGAYVVVERGRTADPPLLVEPLDLPRPELQVRHGATLRPAPTGPHLVHFWATWCAPCVEELPALLAAAEEEEIDLLAVTAEDWSVVEAWFRGEVPSAVVRDSRGDAAEAWRVSGLPDTFVVRDGRVVGRMGGPRAWGTPSARAYLREVVR